LTGSGNEEDSDESDEKFSDESDTESSEETSDSESEEERVCTVLLIAKYLKEVIIIM